MTGYGKRRFTAALAAVLVTTVVSLPAAAAGPLCGLEEHVHGAACYKTEQTLVCGLPEAGEQSSVYGEAAPAVSLLVLPEEAVSGHTHGEACYETVSVLTCELSEHTHDAACYGTQQAASLLLSETDGEVLPEEAAEEFVLDGAAYTASARADDISTVSGDGIRFRLFNYSSDVNKTADGSAWRTISSYFTFRDNLRASGTVPGTDVYIPVPEVNNAHDADGFVATHATVERVLRDGYPLLDLTRNADGTARSDPGLGADVRSLAWLFGGAADHAVTAYSPSNTILQKNGSHYWYDSAQNAVDYDAEAGVFRLRNYVERNSTTAGYGSTYGDFIPFTCTDGQVAGTTETGAEYHVLKTDTDYWFGMAMEVDFFQTKDGLVDGEEMVFRFSGDDDVWVFVDGVLVLDLGGTHGTVDGSINFATGEVLQYLSWSGANATAEEREKGSATSFPTTIRACFDAAGETPNGGWSAGGETFGDYTKHTLTFFYLERGAAVANCSLNFLLPTLPDKSLTVTKVLESEGTAGEYVEDSLTYAFRVVRADGGGLYLPEGTEYNIFSGGVKTGEGMVNEDGLFYLRAGQSAQFTDMLQKGGGAVEYVVQEIMPDNLTGQYAGVEYEVSGGGGETVTAEGPAEAFTAFETGVLSAEETQAVTYRNRVDTAKLCRLEISKAAGDGTILSAEESFSVQVLLGNSPIPVGTEYTVSDQTRAVSEEGIITLCAGETAILSEGILSGTTYEITEPAVPGYTASYCTVVAAEGQEDEEISAHGCAAGVFPLGSTVSVTVINHSYRLPDTGGMGAGLYTAGGLLFLAAGAACLYNYRRGRKEDIP